MYRALLVLTLILFTPCVAAATTVTSDITSNTTWNNAGSPYTLNPSGSSGGSIRVRANAILTIDSTGGAVDILWNEDCDLVIGGGSSPKNGDLVIKAASGAITFKIKTGGNIRISNDGIISFSDTTATTTFTRYDSSNTWGALIFESSQKRQSGVKKCVFSYGGNDSQDGAIVVDNSATYVPTLENLSFDNCTTSAIKMIGNGVNVLKSGNVTLPFSVTNTTYVLFLNAVASTSTTIVFPALTTPATPPARLDGTCQVGDASNESHWTFGDAYTFKCSAASKVQAVNGYVWGTTGIRPTFQAISGTTYTNWVGLVDDSTSKTNIFTGDVGPFAYLTVRNATTGIDLNKGTTYVPVSGQVSAWHIPGITIRKCDTGIRVRTQLSSGNGYHTMIEGADLGSTSSSDDCNIACVFIDYGHVTLDGCSINGAVTSGVAIGTTSVANTYDVTIQDCEITDSSGTTGVLITTTQGGGNVTITGCLIEDYATGVDFFQSSTGGYTPARSLTIEQSFISATSTGATAAGLDVQVQTASVCTILVDDCTITGVSGATTNYGIWLEELRSTSTATFRDTNIDFNTHFGVEVVSATNNTCEYTFDQCAFTDNGDGIGQRGGIRDARSQTTRVVCTHCTFAGNDPRAAFDTNGSGASTYMLAENCYWNSTTGAGSDVNANVDASPYLTEPYFGYLLGGNPAGAMSWDVRESSGTDADNSHVITTTPYFAWVFGSNFTGDTQSAYQVQVSANRDFSTFKWNPGKTSSTSAVGVTYAGSTLSKGTTYYARIRLWNQDDRSGPWHRLTFHINAVPGTVSDTNRAPANSSSGSNSTPDMVFQSPTDTENDACNFEIEIDDNSSFNNAGGRRRILTTPSSMGTGYVLGMGTVYSSPFALSFPGTGVPNGNWAGITLPYVYPNSLGNLDDRTWYWRVRATDGFENGNWSSTFSFTLSGTSGNFNVVVHETTSGGTTITNNQAAGSIRAFGNQDVSAGATAAATIVLVNTGDHTLVLGTPTLGGTDASQFSLNTSGFSTSLAASANTSFTVSFDPSSTGAKSATISFTHNGTNTSSPFVVNVSGTGVSLTLEARETTSGGTLIANNESAGGVRAFGNRDVAAGASSTATIVIVNTGSQSLTLGTPSLGGGDASQFVLNTSGFSTSLAASSDTSFTVSFDPSTTGAKSATISFTHDGTNTASPFVVNVSGTGISYDLTARETTSTGTTISNNEAAGSIRAFGSRDVAAGASSTATIVIVNTGTQSLTLSTPTLGGSDSSQFVLDTTGFSTSLAASANTSFTVSFDPSTTGAKSATISITHNATNTSSPFVVNVSGTGISYDLTARETNTSGTIITNNQAAGGVRAFGNQDITAGATSAATIVVVNSGTEGLTLGTPSLGGTDSAQFILNTSGFSTNLASGANTSFTVSFDPSTTGAKSATISFTHDGTNTSSPFVVNVSGTGISYDMTGHETTSTGTVITNNEAAGSVRTFGNRDVAAGASASATIVIVNSGTQGLTLGTPSLGGGDASQFVLNTSGFSTSLASGANTSFTVSFDPSTTGAKSAAISFTHTATTTSSPFVVNVSGTGISYELAVHETTTSGTAVTNGQAAANDRAFGTQDVDAGATSAVTIYIVNTGTETLSLGTPSLGGTNASEFVLDTAGFTSSLTASANTSFTVSFNPTTYGSKTAAVSFTHTATTTSSPFVVNVSGSGVNGTIEVRETNGAGTLLANNDTATGGRDFGTLDVINAPSVALTIFVKNTSADDVYTDVPSLGGADADQFSLTASGFPAVVTAGNNVTFQVRFVPTSNGAKNATISFAHFASNESSPFIVNVTGVGYEPPTGTVTLASGFIGLPQGTSLGATIEKSGGLPFVSGVTVSVAGSGVTGSVTTVTSDDEIAVNFTTDATADAGVRTFHVYDGGTRVATGTITVLYPQQLTAARESGSTQEPPQNATMGGVSTYLHNGEFRHDLPLVSIPGRMLPLGAGVTYRSQLEYLGPVGRGWTASFDNRLVYNSGGDTITVYSGDGRIDTYTQAGTTGVGPYVCTGFFLTITRAANGAGDSDDVYTFNFAHGGGASFTASNLDQTGRRLFRQATLYDRYSNAIAYVYNSNGQLTEIRGDRYSYPTTAQYKLSFAYRGDGRVLSMTDYADYTADDDEVGSSYAGYRQWLFDYDASTADLTQIRLPQTEQYYSETKGANYRTRVKFTYDSGGNMTELIDARQANETTPLGWLQNNYDGSGRIQSQDVGRTSASDTTHRLYLVYTGSPITSVDVIDQLAHRSEYGLNSNGTCSLLRHYTSEWNTALSETGSKIRSTDPASYTSTFEYDSEFNLIETVLPRGNKTVAYFDIANGDRRSRGNLLRAASLPGGAEIETGLGSGLPDNHENGVLATFTYTNTANFNLLATSVSPRAYELGASYDIITNSPITTNDSSEFTTTYTYNTNGTLQNVTSPEVDEATVSPDSLNDGQSITSAFTYNSFGQLETATDGEGVETEYVYGATGFDYGYLTQVRVGSQSASPLITTLTYNSVGRVSTTTDPRGNTYRTYINQLDQAVKSETPEVDYHGDVKYFSRTEYDLNGNVKKSKISNFDEEGDAGLPSTIDTTYTYNILDLPLTVTEPYDAYNNRVFSYEYDLLYRLTDTVLPEGNRAGTDYDELNRAIKSYGGYDVTNVSRSSALIQSEVFFDANSNVIRALDGRGNDSHYLYDALDRLQISKDRLTAPNITVFEYNRAGQTLSATRTGAKRFYNDTTQTYSWQSDELLAQSFTQYDNLGRAYLTLTLAKDQDGVELGYHASETPDTSTVGFSRARIMFRDNGQVAETQDDLNIPTRYEYDAYNRLKKIIDDRDGSGSNDNSDEYGYDENGNVVALTASLFDEVDSTFTTLTSNFYYDSINRLVKDEAPLLSGAASRLTREYRYDSRSNLVKSTDRKGVVRTSEFDLLDRPTRHKTHSVGLTTIGSGGLVSTPSTDIDGRILYDRNSNVTANIDPTGNKTIFRYDLAERWLQTEHADGTSPTAGVGLKTSAGSGHSVSAVGSTVFYSKSGAYDGNSNLLAVSDENGTVISYSYDKNDLPLDESADVSGATANGFSVIGEDGKEFAYDGLYRAGYARNYDGATTLTQTHSVFTTLGQLQRQNQWIYTGGSVDTSINRTVVNSFDESGRRYGRTNPSEITRAEWLFDRKHRPTTAKVSTQNASGWSTAATSAEYQYFGGGLLHSRERKYLLADTSRPMISDIKRDALLRVTSVRHSRDDDSSGTPNSGDGVLARYDYDYDANSMMRYEARWYTGDGDGSSVAPDEVDFYTHDERNALSKALYNVRGQDLTGIDWTDVGNNEVEHSDRVVYARRKSATRNKVNWYRGGVGVPGSEPDSSTSPHQTTNYETTDDPSATVDAPADPGAGSRHNYSTIGQVGMQYDYNRNLLADGTRNFRYNYLNELKKVWRKSDGDTHGLIAEYQSDAYGRQVLTRVNWELARRVYFDTRFELDVDLDADGDLADMDYVDGGITSNLTSTQKASWSSRIDRLNSNDIHYFDFLVKTPEADDNDLCGVVSYDDFEVRIYGDRYEFWDDGVYVTP
ncbi:MAG: choice-of-anchor D domain-containing protein, partial [Planctomycetes bacterium]|nr:choice-of-anchor D domain-containing protein [Planctomycetota bacterium]